MATDFREDLNARLKEPKFAMAFGSEAAKTDFAVTLAKTRRDKSVTQAELARRLRVKQSYIAKLERGDANPTIGMAGKTLAVLGMRLQTGALSLTLKSGISKEPRATSFGRNFVVRCIRHSDINIIGARGSAENWVRKISTVQVG